MRFVLGFVAFCLTTLLATAFLAACVTLEQAETVKAEPGITSRTIVHQPTRTVPYRWTEEVMTGHSPHDTLISADGRRIPGAP